MIKANELRLGNKCTYGAHGVVIVSEIKESGKVRVKHTEQHSIDMGYVYSLLREGDLTPIPLTAEILQKCGFVKSHDPNGGPMFSGYELLFLHEGPDYTLFSTDTYENEIDRIGNSFQFVHQLQNLFFALTGEELNVQL